MYQEQVLHDDATYALKKGLYDVARAKFEDIVSLNPRNGKAYANIADLHWRNNSHHDCIVNYEKAIACEPNPQYLNNIGSALIERNRWEDAESCYREAIRLDPKLAIAHNNLGRLLLVRGRLDEAKTAFMEGIKISPDYPEPHVGLALTHLELGEFDKGWAEYEWRRLKVPQWRDLPPDFVGQKLNPGDAIVCLAEQGLGDSLQFCRYAPLIKQRYGCRVYLEVRPPLLKLMETLEGIDGVIKYGEPFPDDVKYSALLMTCPLLFGHYHEDEFPRSNSYLKASESRSKLFLPYFKDMPPGLKVGFCWYGSSIEPSIDKRRSTNLSMWTPLGEVDGLSWVTLQKGDGANKQLTTTRTGMTILNVIGECEDMADTAALIMHCDLVISVDTAIVHLAAALGKETWVLSRRDACWRWLQDRRDNPWYPTVRHYRQKNFNDWPGLMRDVAVDLRKWLEEKTTGNKNERLPTSGDAC